MTTATRHITQAHIDEWVKGSDVNDAIAVAFYAELGGEI